MWMQTVAWDSNLSSTVYGLGCHEFYLSVGAVFMKVCGYHENVLITCNTDIQWFIYNVKDYTFQTL